MFLVTMIVCLAPHIHLQQTEQGWAKYYRAGLFQQVLRVRHLERAYALSGAVGMVSTRHPERIGQIAFISINGAQRIKVLIVDTSAPRDVKRHAAEHLIFETDYALAVRFGFVADGKARGKIWYTRP